ncbi:unnamed protein product [Prorocentrum cordatum]|uniref:PDZ domain-containing protein n=1 Tax=Prorocentrum cordatum TaxID=2364126 RepID=A0ABN9UB96_9DINO|nr:unnamed protein product [Polarella glacialis]
MFGCLPSPCPRRADKRRQQFGVGTYAVMCAIGVSKVAEAALRQRRRSSRSEGAVRGGAVGPRIELDMTAAHDGTPIGVELWSPKNNQPLAVKSVAEVGLVQSWNAAHPDRAVRAGDEVIINDVKWQNHNRMFIQHLQKVFGFLKEQRPGMQKVLELGFQRPKRWRTPLDSAKSESLR